MKYVPGSINHNGRWRSRKKGKWGRRRKILWGTSRLWKRLKYWQGFQYTCQGAVRSSSAQDPSAHCLFSWLMGEILRFSIITRQRTGVSVRRPSWSYQMKKWVRQREKTELHFQTLTLCVYLQKAFLPDGHMEPHTHIQIILPLYDRTWLISTGRLLRRKQE